MVAESTSFQDAFQRKRKSAEAGGALLWALVMIGLALAVFFACLLFWHLTKDTSEFERELRTAIVSSSASVAFFGALYQVLSRTNFDRVVRDALTFSLGGDAKMFQTLSPEVRKNFVGANLEATLGDETGRAVFANVVGPLMDKATSYRRGLKYDIEALDNIPAFINAEDEALRDLQTALSDTSKYFWLRQSLTYDLRKPVGRDLQSHRGPFEICLAFDEPALDRLMQRDEVFFREVIKLAEPDREKLLGLSKGALVQLLKGPLKFEVRAKLSGNTVGYEVDIQHGEGVTPLLRITTEHLTKADSEGGLDIEFQMPQLRDCTRFVVALPQPTQNPEVRFKRAAHMTNLEPVRYLSRMRTGHVHETKSPDGSADPLEFQIQVEGWTFPTSGVMFVWENR